MSPTELRDGEYRFFDGEAKLWLSPSVQLARNIGLSDSRVRDTQWVVETHHLEFINAWVPLAAWFRRHGAKVVMVPPEHSADLRDYYNKHAKTDRLDAELLARLPGLHPDGLHIEQGLGCAEPLLEILGPDRTYALGTVMTATLLLFLTRWPGPQQVLRLGLKRLTD